MPNDLYRMLVGLLVHGEPEFEPTVLVPYPPEFAARVALQALGTRARAVIDGMTGAANTASRAPESADLDEQIGAAFCRAELTPRPLLEALVKATTDKRWQSGRRRRAALAIAGLASFWALRLVLARSWDLEVALPGEDGAAIQDALDELDAIAWPDPVWDEALSVARKIVNECTRRRFMNELTNDASPPSGLRYALKFAKRVAALEALECEARRYETRRLRRLEEQAARFARRVFGSAPGFSDHAVVVRGAGRTRTARLLGDASRHRSVCERAAVALAAVVQLDELERTLRNDRPRRLRAVGATLRVLSRSPHLAAPQRDFVNGVLERRWQEERATPERCRALETRTLDALARFQESERPVVRVTTTKERKRFVVLITGGEKHRSSMSRSLVRDALLIKAGKKPKDRNAPWRLEEWVRKASLPAFNEVDFVDER